MEKYDIVIAGNGEPALVCTLSARHTYTDKSIAIIKSERQNNMIEDVFNSISAGFDQTLSILYDDIEKKIHNILYLKSGNTIEYEKLVLVSGSRAIEPPIDGLRKKGVALVNTDPERLRKIKREALEAEQIIIYGGSYFGVELCDELLHSGKRVTIIEKSKRLMPSSFDNEISNKIKAVIEELGGKVILDTKVKGIIGVDAVTGIRLSNDEIINCDFMIICCGSRPNIETAEKLGLIYDRDRGILVDEYFRTSDKSIYAVGECAAKYDFFTSDLSNFLMYNSKMEEAKLLGANLYSVIFNRGKMINYLSDARNLTDKIKSELKELEITYNEEVFISLPRM